MNEFTINRITFDLPHALDRYTARAHDPDASDATKETLRRRYTAALPIDITNEYDEPINGLHTDVIHCRYHHDTQTIWPVKPDGTVPTVLVRNRAPFQLRVACTRARNEHLLETGRAVVGD